VTEKVFASYSFTQDVLANRPATPKAPHGVMVLFGATDTGDLYAWVNSAWVQLTGAMSSIMVDADNNFYTAVVTSLTDATMVLNDQRQPIFVKQGVLMESI
jgi:hypothetical protein